MIRIGMAILTAAFLGTAAPDVAAQEPASDAASASARILSLPPGTRVRIWAPGIADRRLVGVVSAAWADTLVLDRGNEASLEVPFRTVTEVQISRGQDPVLGALYGAGIGALLVGGLAGYVAGSDQSGEFAASDGFLRGAYVGALVGGMIGAFMGPERWGPVAAMSPPAKSPSPR